MKNRKAKKTELNIKFVGSCVVNKKDLEITLAPRNRVIQSHQK